MPNRTIALTDQHADFVDKLVASGDYQNASDVVRAGLRLLAKRDAAEKAHIKALRDAARSGVTDFTAGLARNFDSAATLNRHVGSLADHVINNKGSAARSK